MRLRGNPFWARLRPVFVGRQAATLARRECVGTKARGNEKINFLTPENPSILKILIQTGCDDYRQPK